MLQHMWLIMTLRPRLDRLETKSIAVAFAFCALSALVSYARWGASGALAHFCLLWLIGGFISTRFMIAYAMLSIGCDAIAITTEQNEISKVWEFLGILSIIVRDDRG